MPDKPIVGNGRLMRFSNPAPRKKRITVTTTGKTARQLNEERLKNLTKARKAKKRKLAEAKKAG